MEKIREWLKNPKIALVVGIVAGLVLGLIFAWGVWPASYYNAAPQHLHAGYQEIYLEMAIDSFKLNQDVPLAAARFKDLGPNAQKVLDRVRAKPANQAKLADINNFAAVVQASSAAPGTSVAPLPTQSTTQTQPAKKTSSLLWIGVIVMCLVTLGIAAAIFYFVFMRGGVQSRSGVLTPVQQGQQAAREAQATDYAALGEEPPIAQFMASYKLGDDLFDESFSIDSPSGEFLGECGVGISETIGVGDPKKVTAFEIWLFDKNDIQTVTKVFMSKHAHEDDVTRQRLAAKGEPVLADINQQIVLETQTLQLVARVVQMPYGEGALPPESFFDQFILELAIWQK